MADGSGDPTIGFGNNSYGDRNNVHLYGGSLKMDWTLNGMTLTSVTGARNMDRSMGSSSGSPYIDQDMLRVEQLKTFSQEVRLASTGRVRCSGSSVRTIAMTMTPTSACTTTRRTTKWRR